MEEEDALKQALSQLAQTMGVALPFLHPESDKSRGHADESVVGVTQDADVCKSSSKDALSEIKSSSESEEGELSEGEEEPVTSKVVPKQRKMATKEFTGEVDAESLLRGPPLTSPRPHKKAKGTGERKKGRNEGKDKDRSKKIVEKTTGPRVPCRYWMEGKCSKGEACTFSHALVPNKTSEEARLEEVCRFHIAGSCLKGSSCLYSHDLSKVPCKFFHARGECSLGSACRFSHDAVSEEVRRMLFAELSGGTRDPRLAARQSGISSPAPNGSENPLGKPAVASNAFPYLPLAKDVSDDPIALPEHLKRPPPPQFPNIKLDPAVARYNPFGSHLFSSSSKLQL